MRSFALIAVALPLTACAGGPQAPRGFQAKIASPSAVIAEEIAFNRLAQDKGQWTALRETAAKEATMFVPQPVDAQTWLKGRADPTQSVKWQPHKAFMSCDGKTGVTTGAWQKNGAAGYFTTVWQLFQRSPEDSGMWKWVLDHADTLAAPREAPEFIETRVASCKGQPPASIIAPPVGATMKSGLSRDQSLSYTWVVQPDGALTLEVKLWNGTAADTVIMDSVAAPKT